MSKTYRPIYLFLFYNSNSITYVEALFFFCILFNLSVVSIFFFVKKNPKKEKQMPMNIIRFIWAPNNLYNIFLKHSHHLILVLKSSSEFFLLKHGIKIS